MGHSRVLGHPRFLLGVASMSAFVKHDQDKPRPSLFPVRAFFAIVEVMEIGARKYSADNWRKAPHWSRYYNALQRHLWAMWGGEDRDDETGKLHLAHAGCCLIFLLTYQLLGIGNDDRYRHPVDVVADTQPPLAEPGCDRCQAPSDEHSLSTVDDGTGGLLLCGACLKKWEEVSA